MKPNLQQVAIPEHRQQMNEQFEQMPMDELRRIASSELAEQVVNSLTYNKVEPYSPFEPIQHIFSVNDYTIAEREQSKQITKGLVADLGHLNQRYLVLGVKYQQLQIIHKYNNRTLTTKLVDWLLYDKPFNKELT